MTSLAPELADTKITPETRRVGIGVALVLGAGAVLCGQAVIDLFSWRAVAFMFSLAMAVLCVLCSLFVMWAVTDD